MNFKQIKKNKIRQLCNYLNDTINLKGIPKYGYLVVHWLFAASITFIAIFNTNIVHLLIILCILGLDAFSIVVLHNCPLTLLEQKYMKKNYCNEYKSCLGKLGISYNCNHAYESQIELLINMVMLVSGKCLAILVMKTFDWKLVNNDLYK